MIRVSLEHVLRHRTRVNAAGVRSIWAVFTGRLGGVDWIG